jgi:subtilase family serine protease
MALPVVRPSAFSISRLTSQLATSKYLATFLVLAVLVCTAQAQAQFADRVPQSFDPTPAAVLPYHHPLWASPANDQGALDANQSIDNLTMVLARSPQQQQAFDQLLVDQQNPASPEYHHWLTPVEVGTRFGLSDHEIASISGWLESQGLHVNWVAPSKIFIAFGGSAASIGHAFGTSMHAYKVHGDDRISVSSDPRVPTALAPVIQAVRGLFTIQERPQSHSRAESSTGPEATLSDGSHVIAPADFAVIYDVPSSLTGSGVTIGIVGESRTDMADFTNFKSLTGSTFTNPTEVIPTAYGGVDPGAALTTPPACEATNTCTQAVNEQIDLQGEATLDVTRSGTVAPGANLVLVTAAYEPTGSSDGIYTDAQYIVGTTSSPGPFQVMSISFGGCESGDGPSDVSEWSSVFQSAQMEGISVFVSSGDSGAAGCDISFQTPPAVATAASPNALCSPMYETCVGGTEFNDTASPSTWWSSSNGTGFLSALSYIPEGAWNEPGDTTDGFDVAGTGGGVSAYVATPSWQTGTGVPSAKAGRYTPDVAFSSSGHDAYFNCMAAAGGSCVVSGGSFEFIETYGTSAAAPSMAGVAALLDQKMAGGQGNLDPTIYSLAASRPAAFHDVTVTSSGVSSCGVGTPSMCNNSVASSTALTGGTQGYLVQTGYDEATGWGSLDVSTFINDYAASSSTITPTVNVTPGATTITIAESLTVSITVSSTGNPTPTGSVTLTSGTYTSSAATLSSGAASIIVPAGSLAQGTDTLSVSYTPDSGSSSTYNSATGTNTVLVDSLQTPSVTVTPGSSSISTSQSLTVSVTVGKTPGFGTPTGSVKLTSGSYASSSTTLSSGKASIVIPAGSLATGSDTLTVAYTPDSTSTPIYNSNTGSTPVTVTGLPAPPVTVTAGSSTITTGQPLSVSVKVSATSGNPTPTGSVKLSSGSYTSAAATLSAGAATIAIPAGSLAQGSDSLSVTYTPDTGSSTVYVSSTGTTTVVVDPIQSPGVFVGLSAPTITIDQPVTVSVTVANTTGFGTPTGTVKLTGGGYTSSAMPLTTGTATINVPAGSLATGADTLTVTYTPDSTSSPIYSSNTGNHGITVDPLQTPTLAVTPTPASITTAQSVSVKVTVAATTGFGTPTGTVKLTSGSYASAVTSLTNGSATINVPAGSLATGNDTLSAAYTPDTASTPIYIGASGSVSITVSPLQNPTVTVTPSLTIVTTGESLQVSVSVAGTSGFGTPTGSVKLTSGSYASAATTLTSGSATITVPAGSLATGSDALSVAYTPDTNSSTIYLGASGSANVTVDPLQKPAVTVTPAATTITTAETLSVIVQVSNTSGFATPTGSVKLTSGSYASAASTLASGSVMISVPAGALATAGDTLTATYTPDSVSSPIYTSDTGTSSVTVDALQIPTVTVTPAATSINASQSLVVTVAVAGTTPFGIPTGSVSLVSGSYTSAATTLSSGSVQITIPAGSLAVATDSIEAIYSPDSASSVIYTTANGTANVTVTPAPGIAPGPGGTTSMTLEPGATTGNTGTISVIGTNGFTGTVELSCYVTTSAGGIGITDMPTCTLSPTSVTITGAAAQTSTLTVNTTGPGSAANEKPNLFWPSTGGTALALMLFFITPRRRRSWLAMVSIVVLFVAMGLTACSKNSKPQETPAGGYIIRVTGASGTISAPVGTVALTVQ